MGQVIDFQKYVQSKEEEKARMRKESQLISKYENLSGVLHRLNESMGTSFLVRDLNEFGQLQAKEIPLDNNLLDIIFNGIESEKEKVKVEINEIRVRN